jgi:hypothetical protein
MRPGFRASKLTVFLRARLSTVESYRSGLHGPAIAGAAWGRQNDANQRFDLLP